MRRSKSLIILLASFALSPFHARAQNADTELRNYTPPPMFGGASTPLSAPVPAPQETPAQTPAASKSLIPAPSAKPAAPKPLAAPAPVSKPAPAKKPAPKKTVTPPSDKEQFTKPEPLPIEPLTPKKPQKPTKPPADKEKTPAYVAPLVKKTPTLPIPAVNGSPSSSALLSAPVTRQQPAPSPDKDAGGISAESLLSHPVTSDTAGAAPDIGAVGANNGDDLPVPLGVKPTKKTAGKVTDKKAAQKKPTAPKAEPKKPEPKKPEEKKTTPAPVKPVETPPAKKEEPPASPPDKKAEAPKIQDKTYTIKGRKSMPSVMPAKVDKAELAKAPLPPPETDPKPKSAPTPNEQAIDRSLQDHLVEPDIRKIAGAATPPPAKSSKAFTNPKGSDPPPIIMMNNKNGNTDSAPPAGAPDKVKPQLISLEFKDQSADVSPDMKKIIDESIYPKIKADKYARLQILAYASPTKDGQSSARRISLARGLAIRSYMLEKGMEPGRIDIRALGENSLEKPLDRADLMIISYK